MRGHYVVKTIGALDDLPAGWVPAGPPRPPVETESVSGPLLAAVGIGGVLLGALGFWALKRWT